MLDLEQFFATQARIIRCSIVLRDETPEVQQNVENWIKDGMREAHDAGVLHGMARACEAVSELIRSRARPVTDGGQSKEEMMAGGKP